MIGADVFSRIKELITMPRLISSYGLKPDKNGFIRCPFHANGQERTPSVKINEKSWHCFACGAGGSVIDWTMMINRLSTPLEAARSLDDHYKLGLFKNDFDPQTRRKTIEEVKRREAERRRL